MVEVGTRSVAQLSLSSMHKALGSISTSYLYSPHAKFKVHLGYRILSG